MKKRDKIIYWIATIWLALGMTSSGIIQAFQIKLETDTIAELGYPGYFLILIGIWKMLGAIAILIPKFPLLKEWAYAGFFFVASGAAISHIVYGHGVGEIIPALLLLTLTFVSWYFRPANRKTASANITTSN